MLKPMMLRRLVQLFTGLTLYGVSLALMVRANLGLDPWDVFHQGVSRHLGWSLGTVVNVTGALVLLLWIPLRQRPGVGTISNVFVIGFAVDAALEVLPPVASLPPRILLLACGVLLNAVATAAYIGARLGPGPRDGLMTGLVARTGRSTRVIRTGIEMRPGDRLASGGVCGHRDGRVRVADRAARPAASSATYRPDPAPSTTSRLRQATACASPGVPQDFSARLPMRP